MWVSTAQWKMGWEPGKNKKALKQIVLEKMADCENTAVRTLALMHRLWELTLLF